MSPDTDATDTEESSGNSTTEWPTFERRPLLKALGAGATLSLGSGVATAETSTSDAAEIDPHYGYATPDVNDIPADLTPDREIELHITLNDPESDHASFYGHFEPTGLQVDPGDIVQFTFESAEHTISAYRPKIGFQPRVPDDSSILSSPIVGANGAWLYQFDQAGVYDLFCGPHHVFGMNMRVLVGDATDADAPPSVAESWETWEEGDPFPPWNRGGLERELNEFSDSNEGAEWSWLTPQEILDRDVLVPAAIQDQGSVSFEDVLGEIDRFGDELPDDHG